MAYRPPNPGWGAAASAAKKKKLPPPPGRPNKPVGSFDPYRSTDINSVVDYLTSLQAGGPEYGKYVTEGPSSDALQQQALTQSAWQLMPAQLQYERQQMQSRSGRETSQQAATAFTQALSEILQGGKTGDEGMAFAKENYGGSYLGVIAAQMGADLFKQITHDFDQQDFELADKLGTVMAQQPEIMQKVYDSLVETEQARVKGQMQDAETDYKNRVQALGFRIGELRKSEKAQGGGESTVRTAQTSTKIIGYDKVTGAVVWEIPTPKDPSDPSAPTTRTVNGVFLQWDPASRTWNPVPGVSSGTGAGGKPVSFSAAGEYARSMTANTGTLWKVRKVKGGGFEAYDTGKVKAGGAAGSSSSQSTTAARAQKAAAKILTDKGGMLPRIWAKHDPGADATPEERAAATKAAQAEASRNFGGAMYKVITAITPHLKAIGYSTAAIKWEAYQIVRQSGMTPLPSYKAPKPPKAEAARAAASNTTPTLDFGSLSRSTVGKVGQDLGGPEAHHARPLGNWQSDNAWDIGIPIGTPIYAITDGVVGPDVGSMSSRPGDGQRLTLSANDNAYWYGHLSRISVKPGQRVRAGQLLGYSGASANGAAHLHLGVRDLGGTYS